MNDPRRILLSYSEGNSQLNGIYEHELDAMERHAPVLAGAEKILLKNLSSSRTDSAQIVIIVIRRGLLLIDSILDGIAIQKKGEVKVFILWNDPIHPDLNHTYRLWKIGPNGIWCHISIPTVFYQFKRCGGDCLKPEDAANQEGFSSVDFKELEKSVLQ